MSYVEMIGHVANRTADSGRRMRIDHAPGVRQKSPDEGYFFM
jgi:hypothetical protein